MARWSRTRLRNAGIGAVAVLGAALLVVPAVSQAGEQPARLTPMTATAPDRVSLVDGVPGFQPGDGDPYASFGYVSAGGALRARRLGATASPTVEAGTPAAEPAPAPGDAQHITFKVDSTRATATTKLMGLWRRDTGWSPVPIHNDAGTTTASAELPRGDYFVSAVYGDAENSYVLARDFQVGGTYTKFFLRENTAKEIRIEVDEP